MAKFRNDVHPQSEIEVFRDCQHTKWSKEHAAKHVEVDDTAVVAKTVGQAKRIHIARETLSIDELESMHSSVRRRLVDRGVHTWPVTFDDLAVNWACDRARCRDKLHAWRKKSFPDGSQIDGEQPLPVESLEDGSGDSDGHEGHANTRGGGGTWRAFVREATRGKVAFKIWLSSEPSTEATKPRFVHGSRAWALMQQQHMPPEVHGHLGRRVGTS